MTATHAPTAPTGGRALRAVIWLPGLAVAVGAAVATAHGLYEVAVAARVPAGIAWLYPLITDGLALVAYAATARLRDGGRRYAWAVVILAAGLSGLAQAAYLASDGVLPPAGTSAAGFAAPAALRFGVGAWPAIAAAIVAHLLYLLATDYTTTPEPSERPAFTGCPAPSDRTAVRLDAVPSTNGHRPTPTSGPAVAATAVGASDEPFTRPLPVVARPSVRALDAPARERACAAARRHLDEHGTWPTVRQLMVIAEVSRGTAGDALKTLRSQPARPDGTHDSDYEETQR